MTRFETQCNEVAERHGLREPSFNYNESAQEPFEDDGFLHIVRRGIRAVFSIGQDTPSADHNRLVRLIMTDLGLEKKIGKHVLVEEEDEDNTCPHCGRSLTLSAAP